MLRRNICIGFFILITFLSAGVTPLQQYFETVCFVSANGIIQVLNHKENDNDSHKDKK